VVNFFVFRKLSFNWPPRVQFSARAEGRLTTAVRSDAANAPVKDEGDDDDAKFIVTVAAATVSSDNGDVQFRDVGRCLLQKSR